MEVKSPVCKNRGITQNLLPGSSPGGVLVRSPVVFFPEGHQTNNLVVAAEITRQVGIQTMSATDFLILPSPQPWPRAMLQGAHWGRRDSGTCHVTLG